jgi:hypothetical protein
MKDGSVISRTATSSLIFYQVLVVSVNSNVSDPTSDIRGTGFSSVTSRTSSVRLGNRQEQSNQRSGSTDAFGAVGIGNRWLGLLPQNSGWVKRGTSQTQKWHLTESAGGTLSDCTPLWQTTSLAVGFVVRCVLR